MKKRYAIFFTILGLSTFAFGQVHKGFQWISPDHSLFKIDINSGILSQDAPKKSKTELGKIQDWESIKSELPGDFGVNAFYQADSILITIPGTGQIFSLDLANLKLNRLDQTFFRGYNFNASQFFRKDTLFSIGGDGFWLKHSIITYYNPQTSEWAFYKFQKDNKHPSKNKFSGYSKEQDAFFSSFLEVDENLKNNKVPFRIYSFKNDNWEEKGFLSAPIIDIAKNNYRTIWTGKYLFLIFDNSGSKYYIAEPFQNMLYEHKSTNDQFYLNNSELYFQNGKIFSRSMASTGKIDKIYFDSLSVDSLVKQSSLIGPVYEYNDFSNRNIGITSGTLLVLIGSFFYYRKRKKLKMIDSTLTEVELLVVKKFINQPIGIKTTSIELNNLLEISTKTYDNQRQIRYRVIGAINQKLRKDLDSKHLIFRSSNIEDKRMMDYYINPEIKTKDLEKLVKSLNL
jgi:hypothetical protein